MTREDAIKLVKEVTGMSLDWDNAHYEALQMAIKALEQESSDDCVSRKAMLDAITEIDNNVNMDIYTNEVREIIRELPPVTPTRKKGKWNILGCDLYMCSKCYAKFTHKFNYCPNCGAEMESEE